MLPFVPVATKSSFTVAPVFMHVKVFVDGLMNNDLRICENHCEFVMVNPTPNNVAPVNVSEVFM